VAKMNKHHHVAKVILSLFVAVSIQGCGGTGTGNPTITLQSAPLAGPNAASMGRSSFTKLAFLDAITQGLARYFFGINEASAVVSSFAKFSACNDTLVFLDGNGVQLTINNSANPSVGQGLLDFSPTSTSPMTIGSIGISAGTVLSEIDITFANVPAICAGANYAVQFDNGVGGGLITITQNTAFKFRFANNYTITDSQHTITLMFGAIVNAMVAKGSALNNQSIQTINVGQAQ